MGPVGVLTFNLGIGVVFFARLARGQRRSGSGNAALRRLGAVGIDGKRDLALIRLEYGVFEELQVLFLDLDTLLLLERLVVVLVPNAPHHAHGRIFGTKDLVSASK